MSQRALLEYEDGQGITFCVHKANPRLKELVELIKSNGGSCTPQPKPGTFCIFFQANPTINEEISLLKSQGVVTTTIAWIYESILSRQLLPWYQYQIGVEEKDAQLDVSTRDLRELAICIARHSQMFSQPDDIYRYLARRLPHRTSSGFRDLHRQHQDVVQSMIGRVAESIDRLVLSVDFFKPNNFTGSFTSPPADNRLPVSNTATPTFVPTTESGLNMHDLIYRRKSISFQPLMHNLKAPPNTSPGNRSSEEEQGESDYETGGSKDELSSDDDGASQSHSDSAEDSESEAVGRKRKRGDSSNHRNRATKRRRVEVAAPMGPPSRPNNVPTPGDLAVMHRWLKERPIGNSSRPSDYWTEFSEKAPTSVQRPWRSWQYVYWNYIVPSLKDSISAPITRDTISSPEIAHQNPSSTGVAITDNPSLGLVRHHSLPQPVTAPTAPIQSGVTARNQSGRSNSVGEISRSVQEDQPNPGASAHTSQGHRKSSSLTELQSQLNTSSSFSAPVKDDPLTSVTSSTSLSQEDIQKMNPDQKTAYFDKIQATHIGKCFHNDIPNINPGSWAVWNRFAQVHPSLGYGADFWQRRYHERESTILKAGFHMFIPESSAL